MADFVMVIFALICMTQVVQLDGAQPMYYQCLNRWRFIKERDNSPSAFLTDQTLVEDVCITGVSVKDMDSCMRRHLDENMNNVLAFWNGIRDRFYRICVHLQDFMRYRRCRTNRHVVNAFETCPRKHPEATCRAYTAIKKCLKAPIYNQCKGEAVSFFTTLVDTEFSPLLEFGECPQESPDINLLNVQTITTTPRPKSTTELQRQPIYREGPMMGTMKEHEEIIIETEVFEENITIYSASSKSVFSVYTYFITTCFTTVMRLLS